MKETIGIKNDCNATSAFTIHSNMRFAHVRRAVGASKNLRCSRIQALARIAAADKR